MPCWVCGAVACVHLEFEPYDEEGTEMDTTDIAAAALKPNHKGHCNCSARTRDKRPNRACPKCKGTGTLTACAECEGSGWNKTNQKACMRCGGAGYL